MRISKIIFSDDSEVIPSKGVNLIVGGNNTGKSTLINELGYAISEGYIPNSTTKWIKQVSLIVENPKKEISSMFEEVENGHISIKDFGNIERDHFTLKTGFKPNRQNVRSLNRLDSFIANELEKIAISDSRTLNINRGSGKDMAFDDDRLLRELLSQVQLSIEKCDMRLQERFEDNIDNIIDNYTQNSYSMTRSLIKNEKLLKQLNRNILEVFGIKIGFDDLRQGRRSLRILPSNPPSRKLKEIERAKIWNETSPLIHEQGDGLRAYLKLVFNMFDEFYKIMIIDEPEAFLHPPQRRALGKILAKTAISNNKQLFIATHDADFIKGVLIGNRHNRDDGDSKDVSVFRTIINGDKHAINLCNLQTVSMYVENNQRIQRVESSKYNEEFLSSLFYRKTILVEDEFDKLFYERYLSLHMNTDRTMDVNYIGLNGKSKIKHVFGQMRNLGLNVACIVDIDFLTNNNDVPDCIRLEDKILYDKHVAFARIYSDMEHKNRLKDNLKRNGIKSLEEDEEKYKKAKEIIDLYAKHGIFIVEVGEVECWYNGSKNNTNVRTILNEMEHKKCQKLSCFLRKIIL
jgi:hypothetical protein